MLPMMIIPLHQSMMGVLEDQLTMEDVDIDLADHLVDLEKNIENPPMIIIASDDEDGDEEEEYPKEILISDDDDDEDTDSVVFSNISSKNLVPPEVPQMPKVNQCIPRNPEVPPAPVAPAGGQANQPMVFCASFALKKDARHWWMTVQMRRNVTNMSWQDFVTEFREIYYNRETLAAQQDEFNSMKQGSMTVLEAVKKFEQLARMCPKLIPTETEKDKETRAQIFKAKKEERAMLKQSQPN
ncbi:hypothetical protein TIFTF001_046007 [Ficus carica]|uniref:Retrotransposon gag domain-containing protein n=1 Tax=Ficus carica TaxID=3494 RepID=A0AA88CQU7_FICCA|nr:hypothetical protein TIFTF001_046007 [Ficus carica]